MKALTAGVLSIGGAWVIWSALGDQGAADLAEAHRRAEGLDDSHRRWRGFAQRREAIFVKIERGETGLLETVRAIEALAREECPEHLDRLTNHETGAVLDEKIANSVWRHLYMRHHFIASPNTHRAMTRCQSEFRKHFGREPVDMTWSSSRSNSTAYESR